MFFEAVKDVQPLKHKLTEVSERRSQPPASDHKAGASKGRALQGEDVSENSFLRNGVQTSVLRRLRRRQIPIEDELDLHGYSTSEAEVQVRAFLARARVPGRQRGVRIIHGKGYGSPEGKSVLKEKTRQWLRENDGVLAFCPADPAQGGTGAVHVLLKRK